MIGPDVSKSLQACLSKQGLDTIEGAFAFDSGDEIYKPGLGHRERIAFTVTDEVGHKHQLYMKRYSADPLSDRLRRWWTHGLATTPGSVEFENILAVRREGILTAEPIICDGRSANADSDGRSYLIVAAVPGVKLEECMDDFLARNANKPDAAEAFTRTLAELVRTLHRAGFVHRDLYSSHIFLHESDGCMNLHLIDLARAFRPRWRRTRWRVKDLAQLKYSPPMRNWAERYWPLFISEYLGRDDAAQLRRWRRRVQWKIAMMRYRRGRRAKRAGK